MEKNSGKLNFQPKNNQVEGINLDFPSFPCDWCIIFDIIIMVSLYIVSSPMYISALSERVHFFLDQVKTKLICLYLLIEFHISHRSHSSLPNFIQIFSTLHILVSSQERWQGLGAPRDLRIQFYHHMKLQSSPWPNYVALCPLSLP